MRFLRIMHTKKRRLTGALSFFYALGVCLSCAHAQANPVHARVQILTAHPLATQAGRDVLARGGDAVDAAVAASLVLGLTSPHHAGLGGGGMALYYHAGTRRLLALDGREKAPDLVGPYLFMGQDGRPLPLRRATIGGRAVGVPGFPALLETLHVRYGRLSWESAFAPALDLAIHGFPVPEELATFIAQDSSALSTYAQTRTYFMDGFGAPRAAGDVLRNTGYARSLRIFAVQGAQGFYRGALAQEIVEAVQKTAYDNPGLLRIEDLDSYDVRARLPVCQPYRDLRVCTLGAPSAGGMAVLQMMGLLSHSPSPPTAARAVHDPEVWNRLIAAQRLVFADVQSYVADPDVRSVPQDSLLDPAYLAGRAAHMSSHASEHQSQSGGFWPYDFNQGQNFGQSGGVYMIVSDSHGNVLVLHNTLGDVFGSHLMAGGFLLNSALADFAFDPMREGALHPNAPQSGKRPYATSAPVIVLGADGVPVLALGVAGDVRAAALAVQTIVALVDWKIPVEEIRTLPFVLASKDGVLVDPKSGTLARDLERKGHKVATGDIFPPITILDMREEKIKTLPATR